QDILPHGRAICPKTARYVSALGTTALLLCSPHTACPAFETSVLGGSWCAGSRGRERGSVPCAMCHVPFAMCHVPCAMCHVPCAMCHVTRDTWRTVFITIARRHRITCARVQSEGQRARRVQARDAWTSRRAPPPAHLRAHLSLSVAVRN